MRYTKIKSQLGIRFIRLPFTEFTHFSLRYFTILCGDYFHRQSQRLEVHILRLETQYCNHHSTSSSYKKYCTREDWVDGLLSDYQ